MRALIGFFLVVGLIFGQSQRTVRRFAGTGEPGNIIGSGYGDVYVRSSNSTVYFCTKIVGHCNGVSAGNWLLPASSSTSPTTTLGDMIYRGSSVDVRLAAGAENSVLSILSGIPAYSPALGTGNVVRASTVRVGAGAADAFKTPQYDENGINVVAVLNTDMPPFWFDGAGLVLPTGLCSKIRWVPTGGRFIKYHLSAQDAAGADVSSTVSVVLQSSPDTGSTTWTTFGTATLTAASSVIDATLSGWTTTLAANRRVRACTTGTPAGAVSLSLNLEFHAQ